MATIILLILGALVLWGVLATILGLGHDGYGRSEIRERNRGTGSTTA
ncbi:MAG: hypothetical protein ABIX44_03055 [Cryobacterium sp.]